MVIVCGKGPTDRVDWSGKEHSYNNVDVGYDLLPCKSMLVIRQRQSKLSQKSV